MRSPLLLCLAVLAARAQTFDVAAIKVSPPIGSGPVRFGMSGGPGTAEPGRVNWSHATVKSLLVTAFDLPVYQFAGPDWLNIEMFDIAATVPPDTTSEQMRTMLRNLLAERFGMKTHREKKELPAFVMTIARGGPKLKASASGGPAKYSQKISPGRVTLFCTACPAALLSEIVAERLNKPVTDATGLAGIYDFTLVYEPEFRVLPGADGPPPPPPGSADASPIQSAIQTQLGLKLVPMKLPVDIVVIDRIEKAPAEN